MKPFSPTKSSDIIPEDSTVFWFRRDLRLTDNCGLYHALREGRPVVPIFIFDTEILNHLEDKQDRRVEFIHQALQTLQEQLVALGSSLVVVHGSPLDFFSRWQPRAVFTNHDYEPYARERDERVKQQLNSRGIAFHTFKDQVIFEKDEVVKDDGRPYTVFTPYSKKWKARLAAEGVTSFDISKVQQNFKKMPPQALPTLEALGFKATGQPFPPRVIKTSIIEAYDRQRNHPGIDGTTRLSVHLRFGTVSIRQLVKVARQKNDVWLNELIWRDFYHMILWHFPHVVTKAFKPDYDKVAWRNNATEFRAWCEGRTGYPIVDAGMRELNATGYMHNRVRMIVASFLTKHLLIDWRWGEAYFAQKLLDFDLAANNGGWQWAAGSGCDAAPYFRVFNPALQTEKFDPNHIYIKKWLPELGTPVYPAPIVDHAAARERVLNAYSVALKGQ